MRRPNRSRMKGELRWFSIRREGCSEYQVHTYLDPHAVTPGPQSPLSWAAAGWHWAPCIGGQRSAGNSSMGSMAPHAATLVSQCRITACRRGSGVTLGMAVGRLRPRNLVPGSGTPPPFPNSKLLQAAVLRRAAASALSAWTCHAGRDALAAGREKVS